jgi:hypothetical protein
LPVLYRHTQIAWAIIIPADLLALLFLYLAWAKGVTLAVVGFFVVLLLTYLFYGLTIIGTEDTLELRFGIGLIRKRLKLKEIMSIQPHRTSFWNGWGIHYSREGTIYNVSGYDAVRLTMTDGRHYIIGTDQPRELLRFIESHR